MDPHVPLRVPEKVRRRLQSLPGRTTEPMTTDEFRRLVCDVKVVNAPLDGYSDPAWRTVCLRRGAGMGFTEMVPAIALVFGADDAIRRLQRAQDEKVLAVQIEGSKPEIMVEAAKIAEGAGADVIDVNAGCPSSRVTNSGAGSALLSDLGLLVNILESLKKTLKVPVTLKVRSGPTLTQIVIREVASIVNDLDIAAVTLHPRARSQVYRGRADWALIREFKSLCRPPVIGNGDIRSPEDAVRMITETGCDAVMVARGAIGNPWLFGNINNAMAGNPDRLVVDRIEWERTIWEHFGLLVEYLDNEEALAARLFRKHLARYTRGMVGGSVFREGLAHLDGRESLNAALKLLLYHGEAAGGFVYPMPRPEDTFS